MCVWNPISTWYWVSLVHAIWNFCRIYYYGPKPCVLLFSAFKSYMQIQSAFRRRLQCLWAINVNSFVLRSVSDHGDHGNLNWHMTLLLAKLSSMLEYGLLHSYVNHQYILTGQCFSKLASILYGIGKIENFYSIWEKSFHNFHFLPEGFLQLSFTFCDSLIRLSGGGV